MGDKMRMGTGCFKWACSLDFLMRGMRIWCFKPAGELARLIAHSAHDKLFAMNTRAGAGLKVGKEDQSPGAAEAGTGAVCSARRSPLPGGWAKLSAEWHRHCNRLAHAHPAKIKASPF